MRKIFLLVFSLLSLTYTAYPQGPGCPGVNLGPDITKPCSTSCINLTANFLQTGLSDAYTVTSIPYAPPFAFNSGTSFSIGTDDIWSGVINLPFNFCFFGTNYNKVVVGANGVISFNTGYASGTCPWQFTNTVPYAGNNTYGQQFPRNAIFGAYHDVDPSVCGNIRYNISGTAPCRTFVFSYDAVCQYSCNGNKTTQQIVLYETTNAIEVYIQNKPVCGTWNNGNAVIGIQNAAGTVGYTPPGRNTGPWAATNEAWRFTPSGTPNYTIAWYQGAYGTPVIGTTPTISVCPTAFTTYSAVLNYTRCDGTIVTVFDDINVSIEPNPAAPSFTTNSPVCQGQTINLNATAVTGATYMWSGPGGWTATGQNPTRTGATTAMSGTYSLYVIVNGCTSATTTQTVTVNPLPTVNAVSNQTICAGATSTAVTFAGSAVAGTTYNWTSSNTAIGTAASGSNTFPAFTGVNAGTTPISSTITVTPTANGCPGTPITFMVTVNPRPTVNAVGNQTLCAGAATSAVTFAGSGVVGTTYNWTSSNTAIGSAASGSNTFPSFTATNATSAPISSTITVTPTANGCSGTPITFTVTVNPTPSVTAVSNQTVCAGAATAGVTFSGPVAGTTYNWTSSNPAIGSGASGSNTLPAFTAVNAGTTPVSSTITVTPTANGCPGTPITFTITVNPIPTSGAIGNQTVCAGASTTAVNFTGGVGGTVFNWTNNNTAIGLGASGTGNIAAFTATNTGTAPITGTITVTPTAAGCPGTPFTFTITVNPRPTVNSVPNQTLCAGAASTAVTFGGAVVGTTYNWTSSNPAIGSAASGSNTFPSFTAVNAGTNPISSTITVTPTVNGCTGTPITFTVTVNPIPPTPTFTTNSPVCQGQQIDFFGPNIAGATYYWSGPLGWTQSGTNANIGNATPAMSGTYSLYVVVNGCTSATATQNVTVNPTPTVNPVGNQTLCNGASTTAITFSGAVAGTTYNWTNSNPSIGLAASGNGNIASFTAVNTGSTPVTSTITVTPTANGCPGSTPMTFTITVNPTPTVNAVGNQTLCAGAATSAVNFTGAVTGTNYAWSNTTTSIGLGASGSGNIGSFTATNTGTTPVTATVTVTPTANGCSGTPGNFTITVNPRPTVNTVSNQTLCNGGASTAINFTGNIAGTTYDWTNSNASIGLAASGTGNIGSFTATNTGTAPVTSTITVTPTINGCAGTPTTFTITVNPTATVNAVANQTLCAGAATTAINFAGPVTGTTFAWTNSNTSTGLAASGNGNIASFTATNATSAPITSTVTVTPTANGCTGTPSTFTITVNPTATVNTVPNQTLCNGAATTAVNFAGPVTGTTFAWANNNTATGLAASGNGNIGTFTATNTGAAPITSTVTVTPTANGCAGTPNTFTITVNPTPTVNNVPNQTVCNGAPTTAVTFGSPVTGTTFAWTNNTTSIGLAASGNGNIASFNGVNTGTAPVTSTVTVTPTANSCVGTPNTFTITVTPTTTVNAIANQTVCNGAATTAVTFGSPVAGTTFAWTNSNTTIGLAGSGNGNIGSFTATNTGTAPVTSTITVTPTVNGCVGTPSTFTITVNPTATVNTVPNQTLCNGATTAAVNFAGPVTGTTFAWANNNTATGLAASGNGNIGTFTATNTGATPITSTVTVTPTANGCVGTPSTFTITVNPTATVNNIPNQTLCNGATTTAVNFAGPVTGTTFAWANNNTSIGLAASGNGNIGTFTATNTGAAPITSTITVTPTANGCAGTPNTFTITVNPTPTVDNVPNQTLCNGATTTAVNFAGPVAGTTFAWTNSDASIGLAASGNGNIATFTATNTGTAPVTSTITITPTANGCAGTPSTFTITVNPTPTVSNIPNQTVCNGAPTTAVTFGSPVTGATFAWSNNTTSIGLGASGNGNIASFTATNMGTTPITSTVTVTPTANGCVGTPNTFTITVNPTSTVDNVANQTLCNGATTTAVNFAGPVTGTTFAWANNNTSTGLAASGNGNIGTFTATNTGTAPITSTVTVTPTANGCMGTPNTFTITVNPTSTVNNIPNQTICNGAATTAITLGSPVTGTTFTWTNDNTTIGLAGSGTTDIATFNAVNTGTAPVTATVTVTPTANGCVGTPSTFTITVNPTPTVNNVPNQTLCNGATTTAVNFAGPVTGTTFAWANNNTSIGLAASGNGNIGTFTATNTGAAPITSTITVTPTANGCAGTPNTFTITVNPTPTVNNVPNQTLCNGATTTAVNFAGPVAGTTFAWTNSDASIGLAASGNGNIATFTTTNTGTAPIISTITVTPTANGCVGTPNTFTITVNPTTTVNAIANQTVCNGAATTAITLGSAVAGTTFAWTNDNTTIGLAGSGNGNIGTFTATNTGAAPITSTITVTPTANGCVGTPNTFTITVNPTSTVDNVANQALCNGATTAVVNFAGPVSGTTFAWANNNTSTGLAGSGNGNIGTFTATNTGTAPVTSTITITPTANGCVGTPNTFTITVNPTPTVDNVANQTLCNGAATTAVNITGPVAGTTFAWTNSDASIGLAASGNGNIATFTATNAGTGPVTSTITITPTANGCVGTPNTFTITVNPTPTVDNVANQTLCNGATTTAVNFTSPVAGTTFAWTNSDASIGLASIGNSDIASFTATNAGTAPVTSTITVTPTANGCVGTPNTFTITVNPTPTVNNVPNQTLCNGATMTAVNFAGPVSGTTFAWANNNTSTGLAGSSNGNIGTFTATNTGTAPITSTVTVTPTANGCVGTPNTFTITVNPTATVDNIANQTLCNGATTTAVNFTSPVSGTTFAWTNSDASIGLAANGNGNIATFTATNTGTAPLTSTITITPTANGCVGTSNTFTITVNPTATVDNVPNQTLCNGASTTTVVFSNPVAGTTYDWVNTDASIGLAASGTGNIASFTATNTGTAPVTSTVTITPTANGCVGTPSTFTVTVNPTPTVDNIANQTLCNGAATTAVNFTSPVSGTTFAWTNSDASIGLAISGNGNIGSFTATNTGTAPVTATVTITPTANGCVGTPNTFTITVNPTTTVNPIANQTVCNGAATTAVIFGSPVTGTTFAWTNDNTTIGLAGSGATNIASFNAVNTGTAPVTATVTVTPTANGCVGIPSTFTITVNPTPTVNNVPNQTLCNGATTTAVNFAGPVSGTTFAWANNNTSTGLAGSGNGNIGTFTVTNTGTAPITSTVTVTPTANGCVGTLNTFTITVNPTPTVDNVANQTLCNGATTTAVNFTSPVAGTTFAWTNSDASIGLAANGNGNIATFTATNAGTAPVTSTITITPTANGCVGTPNTFTITVNPTPTVDNIANQTLCNGAATTAVNITGPVAGTTFAWTNSDASVGLASNGTGDIASFNAVNTGTAPVTSTITITPTANGCVGTSNTFTITVNPTATVDNVPNQTLCNGASTAAIVFSNPVAGTTYDWVNTDASIGLAVSGTGNIASFTATNTGTAPVTSTITITPTANGCVGTPNTFTITVNPTPTVDNVANQTLCNGATTTAVNFTSPVAGTTFAWTNSDASIGLAANGNGNIATFTATNAGTAPVTSTITITPTANGCVGTPNTFTITVNPTPTVNAVANQTLCNGATTTAVNFTSPVSGTTFAWTNSDASIGLAASGNGNIATFTATNAGTAPVTSTITITPTANGCVGTPNTFTITVNPTPTVDNVANQTLCNGATTTAVNFTSPVAGTTFAWTNSDASIGLAANGNGNIATFTATNAGTAPVTSTITITPTANGCVGTPNTFTITVNPTPTVDNIANQTLCNGAATTAVNITGPVAGTTFAWTNSDASIGLAASGNGNIASFNAVNTGTSPVTSSITITPTANGCVGTPNTFTITVNPTATVDNVPNQTLCNGASTAAIVFSNPVAGTIYDWVNTDASIGLAANGNGNIATFTATNMGTAPVTSTITVTPTANGCVGTPNTFTITVNPTPTVDNVANQTLCNGATTTAVNFTSPVAGTTFAWTNSDASIGLAANGNGNIATFTATNAGTAPVTSTITITPTANGCVGTPNTFTITVNPTPTVDNVANQTLCNGATTTAVNFTSPVSGTTFAWTNSDASIGLAASGNGNIATFTATNAGTAPVTSTITITPTANGCVGTPNTFTITVNPTPTVDNVANQTLCNGATTTAVNFTSPVAGTTFAWINDNTSIGLAGSGTTDIATFNAINTGTAPVTATVTVTPTANGCVGIPSTFTITVNPTPTVNNVPNQTLCNGATTTAVNFVGPVSGTTFAWANNNTSTGLAGSGNGNIGTFTATNTGTAPITSTVTVTPTANGCVGTPNTFTITVNPTATVDNIANQTLCNGATTTAVNFTSPVSGTTFAWSNNNTSTGLAANGNGNIGIFTATNTGTAPIMSTVTVTPTANGCVGTPNTFTITVNPTPTVDNVSNQTLCNGATTTAVNFTSPVSGTTFAWTNSDASIGLAANGNGNIAMFTATNAGTAPLTSTITITPTANGCEGTPNTFTITVNPTATVDNVSNQTLCNGASTTTVVFSNPVAGTTYDWVNTDASIGLAASGTGNIASFTATNTGTAPVTSTVTITPTANGCVGTPNTFTITVNPTPTVDNIANQTLCNGAATTAVNITGPVMGTTFAWTNSDASIGLAANGNGDIATFTATNTGTTPVTSTITITPTANGCVGTPNTFTITVNPTPTVNNVPNQTLCNGATTTAVNFAGPVAGTTFAWTNSDASIGLAASGNGNIATFTATNAGTAPVTSTITVTPTANGCVGTPNTFTITVNPTPTVDNIANRTLCNGAATTAVNITSPVAGTIFAWTNSDASIGLAASGNGDIATFTATNTGTAPVTSTITITPTANGCVGTPNTFTITVNPTPTVDNVANQTLCNGSSATAVNFTSPVAGTTFAWTNSDASIGLAASGNGNIATFTATNTGTAPVTSTITITPTANGCVGTPNTFMITVNPTPTVDNIANQTLCNGAATTAVNFTSPVAGTTFAWTNSDAGIGLAANGNGNIATFTATNTGNAPVTSTITITPTANGCVGTPNTFTITVNPTPTVDNVANQTLCNGAATTAVNITGPVAGTTFAWTNSDASIGLAASGNGNIATFTATNAGTAPVTSTITITPTANGCVGTPNTFTITVNPTPMVDNVANQTLCNGAATTAVNITGQVAGTTFAWTNSDASIGLAANGNGDIATFTATNTGTAPITSTITITPTANGCVGTPNTFTITVNPTPTVDNVANQTLCNGASTSAVNITGPVAGTTFAWTNSDASIGLTANGNGNIATFTATNAGTAPVTSTITITPTANGCVGTPNTFTITVNPTPTVDNIANQTLCNGAMTTAVNITGPVSGTTFAWTNSVASIGLAANGNGNIATFTATNADTAPVTSTITITPTANGCVGTPNTFTITVNPTPTVDNIANQTLCNGASTTAVNFTSPVAGTTFAWTNSDASIGLASSGNGNIATFTATNAGTAPVTSTITITPTANGCVGTPNTFTITVNPTPTVDNVANQTLCNGAATTAVNFTSPVAGTTFAWTNSDASIGLAANGNGDIASFNAVNTGTAPVTSTITITPTANGCVGTPNTFTITVNPTPTVDNIANQTLCNGATTTAVNFTSPVAGTTFAWTNSDASIGLAANGNGNIATFTAMNTGTAPVTSTIAITPTANGCVGTSNTFTITVNPTPTINPVQDQVLCNGSSTQTVNLTSPVAGVTYDWTNDNTNIGLAASGSGDIASFTATNTSTAPITGTIIITPTGNNCVGVTSTFTITVNPTPTVDNVANQTLCNGAATTAVNITGPVAGTTFAWTNTDVSIGLASSGNGDIATFTATNMGTAPVTSTITITPTANGCVGTPNTFTITVNPTPTVDNIANQTLCNGAATTAVNFTSPVSGTTFAWTNSDASIGLAASGNGDIASFTATNTGTAPVTSTITITPTANGCVGTPNTFTITVNPTPTVDNVANQTLCNGVSTSVVNFTSPVAGTTFAWTNSDASIGLAANGNGNIATFTATNTGTAPVTSTITITPTANGCMGTPDTFTITVNPTPTVDNIADQTLCNGAATTAVNFTSPVAGTTFAWTNSDASIGLAANGNGDIATFTATNTGTAPVTSTITITPTANGCVGTPNTFTITVNPTPTVDNIANQTLCNGAATTAVNITGPVAGTTFAWTNSDASIGLAISGNGNIGSFTATNTGTAPVTSSITVTPTANGCVGTPNTFTITVNPTPTVDNIANQTLCNGAMTTAVNITGPVSGTTFAWTNSDASIGLAASGNGDIATFTATNTGTTPVTSTITITPTANGCVGTPNTFTITVNPTPTVDNIANQTLCNGTATTAVNITGPVAGTTFAWTNSDASIGLAANGNGNIATFTATNAGTAPVTSTITITPTANGCVGIPSTFTITVNPTPTVNNVANQTLCNGATTTAVNFTSPVAGTTFAWTNSDASIGLAANGNGNIATFTATNAGTAPVTSTITITPTANGCVGTPNTFTITVNPTPTVDNIANQTLCNGTAATAVNITGPVAGTTFAWTNSDASIGLAASGNGNIATFTATNTGTAPVTSTITITPTANGCVGTPNTFTITVNPTPTVDNIADQTLCNGSATAAVNITGPVAGTTFAWTNSDASIGLAANGTGDIASFNAVNTGTAPVTSTITITPTANGCVGTSNTFTITVNPTPTVDNVANQTLCNGSATAAVNITGPVAGTTFAWTNSDASIGLAANGTGDIASFNAVNTGTAPVTSTITITPTANGCVGTSNTFTITVNPTPTVDNVANQTLCNGAATTAVNITGPVAGTTFAWTNSDASIGLAASGNGNIATFTATNAGTGPVTSTITITPTANGCVGTPNTFTITVNPTPTVDNVSNQTLCNGATTTAVNFTSPVAGTTFAWTNSDASIGLASIGNGDIASFTATNAGMAPVTSTITITPTANGCVGTPNTFTITVNPTPTVDNVTNQTLCNGASTTAVNFTGPVAGTTYDWVNSNASIGLVGAGTGNIATFSATNTGTAPVTATITVTPTANNCVGTPNTFTITVNPTATVNNVADQTLCNGAATTVVTFSNPVAGTTYNWVNTDASIGLAASGNGDIATFTATNTGTAPVTATITVTPTANNCVGTPNTFTITVNPTPTVDNIANQTVCNGVSTAAVTITSPVAGATFNWVNDNTSIGLASTGTTNIASFNAVNTGTVPVTATITITPTANNCQGPTNSFTITVNPTATVNNVADQTLCNGAATTAVTFANPVAGTTYDWTNSNTGIGLAASGTGNIASFSATNTTSSPVTATITVTPTANNCVGTANTFTITVNPTPTANNVNNQVLCNGDNTTAITFAGPVAGTTFAWTNNNTNIGLGASGSGNIPSFAAANPGSTTLNATIVVTPSANGCTGPVNAFNIRVNPTFVGTENGAICNGGAYTFGGQQYTVAGSYPVTFQTVNGCDSTVTLNLTVNQTYNQTINANICQGAAYTFNGVNYTTTGTYNVAFQTVHGCDSLFVINLLVNNPIASFNANPPIGCVPLTVSFNNLSGPGIVSSAWTFGNGQSSSAASPTVTYMNPGTYTVSLTVTDGLGCTSTYTSTGLIVVSARPTAGMVVNPTELWADEPYVNVQDDSQGATSWWYSISDGIHTSAPSFQHTFTDTGSFIITQIVYNAAGCSDTASEIVRVKGVSTLFVPNAFTPDGDIRNPLFKVYGNSVREFEMMIFNRWGEMIYRTESMDEGWDGTYNGKPCQEDVYVYKIIYRNHKKQQKTLIGSVTLIR